MHHWSARSTRYGFLLAASAGTALAILPAAKTSAATRNTSGVRPGRVAVARFEACSPAWSPDGRRIAFIEATGLSRAGNLWLATLGGGMRRVTQTRCDGAPAWTPDGRLVVARVTSGRFRFMVVNADSGRARPLVPGRSFPVVGSDLVPSAVTFSPRGDQMAFDLCSPGGTLDDTGRVVVMDLRSAAFKDLPTPPKSVTSHPTWSPDGKRVAYQRLPRGWYYNRTGDESYSAVWATEIRTGEAKQITKLEKEISFVSPAWCPGSSLLGVEKWLVSMKRESRREAWLVNSTDTAFGAMLEVERRGSGGIVWAPDGRHYAYIASATANGRFVNELWVGEVTAAQRAAALRTQSAKR